MVVHSTWLLEACPTGQAIHLGILFYKNHYDHFTNLTFAWAMDCIVEDGPMILMHKLQSPMNMDAFRTQQSQY